MLKNFLFFFKVLTTLICEIFEAILSLFFPPEPKNINGKLALITGGGRGLGKALSLRLAREGCNVAICDINLDEALETANEIRKTFNVKSEAFKCDVCEFEQVKELRDTIKTRFGCDVDILVNNAGILNALSIFEGEEKDIKKVLDINLASHFWMIRTFVPKMIENKYGHVLGICSAAGKVASPFCAAYTASKFGVNGLYQSFHDDLCMYDHDEYVKITCAYPGFIDTRKDLEELLKGMRSVIPRVSVTEAADKIIHAMLIDKLQIMFPFVYRLGSFFNSITPPKTTKLLKYAVAKVNKDQEDRRIALTRFSTNE